MNKAKINYAVDVVTLISFLVTAISAVAIYFFMPQGVQRGGFQEFLGISKRAWSSIHSLGGIIFIVSGVLHFILHFKMFSAITKSMFSKKTETSLEK
jgi:hypothetical protein